MGQPLPLGPAVSFLHPPWYWMLGEDRLRVCLTQLQAVREGWRELANSQAQKG